MELQKNELQKFFRDKDDIPKDKVKYYIGDLYVFSFISSNPKVIFLKIAHIV